MPRICRNYSLFTKAIGDGRDAAAATVRDFFAKAVASAGATSPAKKDKVA
jgi:hypothetical protein